MGGWLRVLGLHEVGTGQARGTLSSCHISHCPLLGRLTRTPAAFLLCPGSLTLKQARSAQPLWTELLPPPWRSPQQPRGTAGLARDHPAPTTRGTPRVPRRPGPGHWKGSGALTGWSDASSPGCAPGSSPAAGKAHGQLRTRRVGRAKRRSQPPPTGCHGTDKLSGLTPRGRSAHRARE